MPLNLIPAAIGAGMSVIGAIKGSKPQTSTSTPTLPPELQAVMAQLLGHHEATMKDPARGLAPMRTSAMEGINRGYVGAADRVTTNLAKRGYRSSGKLPGALVGLETSRLSDMSDLEGKMAAIGSDRQMQSADAIQQILSSMRGTTTTGPAQPGAGFSAAGSSLGSLSALTMLNSMLKGRNSSAMQTEMPVGYDAGSYRPPDWGSF